MKVNGRSVIHEQLRMHLECIVTAGGYRNREVKKQVCTINGDGR
jgi:hypothetical protein